jgi:hypothetical protein
MGLICAASLQPGFAPPIALPATIAKPGSAKQMLSFLDTDGKRSHWRDEFDRLSESEADTLAGLLLSIALRRRVARRDFAGLYDVLNAACELDLVNSPAASQAAEMLERLTAYTSIIANHPQEILQPQS